MDHVSSACSDSFLLLGDKLHGERGARAYGVWGLFPRGVRSGAKQALSRQGRNHGFKVEGSNTWRMQEFTLERVIHDERGSASLYKGGLRALLPVGSREEPKPPRKLTTFRHDYIRQLNLTPLT